MKSIVPVFILALCLMLSAGRSFADPGQGSLTQEMIAGFYHQSAQMMLDMNSEEATAFNQSHLHPDFQADLSIVVHVQNGPTQKENLSLNKQQFIKMAEEDARITNYKTINNEIVKLEIHENGRKASVRDATTFSAVTRYGEHMSLDVNGSGLCDDVVTLSDEGRVLLMRSKCYSEVKVRPIP